MASLRKPRLSIRGEKLANVLLLACCYQEVSELFVDRPARLDEMFADRALLQTVRFGELPNGLPVFPRAQAQHQLLPDRFRQRLDRKNKRLHSSHLVPS